jgi:hypothetical protein
VGPHIEAPLGAGPAEDGRIHVVADHLRKQGEHIDPERDGGGSHGSDGRSAQIEQAVGELDGHPHPGLAAHYEAERNQGTAVQDQ